MIPKHFFYIILCFIFITSCSKSTDNYGLENPYDTGTMVEETEKEEEPQLPSTKKPNVKVWEIPYKDRGGLAILPVKVNGMKLDMIFDTGASITTITVDEAEYMFHKGTLSPNDILDYQQYSTANGQISIGLRILLRNLTIGNNDDIVMENIEATVVESQSAPLLLGQSVFNSFSEISIDKNNCIIKFVAKQKSNEF